MYTRFSFEGWPPSKKQTSKPLTNLIPIPLRLVNGTSPRVSVAVTKSLVGNFFMRFLEHMKCLRLEWYKNICEVYVRNRTMIIYTTIVLRCEMAQHFFFTPFLLYTSIIGKFKIYKDVVYIYPTLGDVLGPGLLSLLVFVRCPQLSQSWRYSRKEIDRC